jgi:hypothetical protein
MKSITRLAVILAMGLALANLTAVGGEKKAADRDGNSALQDGGGVIQQDDTAGKTAGAEVPDDLKKAIQDFQAARDQYLKQQTELRKRLGTATGDERAKIREQLKALAGDWVQEQKQYRDRIREELRDLRDTLRNARDKQLDDVKGKSDGKHGKGRH